MKNYSEMKGYKKLEFRVIPTLVNALKSFFCAVIKYEKSPIEYLKNNYDIDVQALPKRGVYIIDEEKTVILGKFINENSVKFIFSIEIIGINLSYAPKFLNSLDAVLARRLSNSSYMELAENYHSFGDQFIENTIAHFLGKGHYNQSVLHVLMKTFHKLSSFQFEGTPFTTGLILTSSYVDFIKNSNSQERGGELYELDSKQIIISGITVNKRLWFLVDGESTFFLATIHKGKIKLNHYFNLAGSETNNSNFVDNYNLVRTLKGNDILFRVTGCAEFSITTPKGIDFNYKEGKWTFRNFEGCITLLSTLTGSHHFVIENLLNYLLSISKKRTSCIIWMPDSVDSIINVTENINILSKEPITITNSKHKSIVMRLLSSDGTTIISRDGKILSFSSMISFSNNASGVLNGSGEKVAEYLSSHGVAMKVSQDGSVKIFHKQRLKLIL